MPKISVIMPTYNAEQYLREAVNSILKQTFRDFELIIVDDNSKDRTIDVLKTFKDVRIRILQGPCRGISAALNVGIDAAKGEYIARMDADDISLPKRLEKQVRYLDTHPEIGFCGTNAVTFDSHGENGYFGYNYSGSPVLERPGLLDQLEGVAVCHPTVMFRKDLVKKYNLRYDEDYTVSEDQELWSRALWYTGFYNIQEPLLRYRIHEENATSVKSDLGMQRLHDVRTTLMKRLMPSFDILDNGLAFRAHDAISVLRNKKTRTEDKNKVFEGQPRWKKVIINFLLNGSER